MSVTIKASLLGRDQAVRELRRFTVEQDVARSFDLLNRKTAAIFGNLRSFSLFYRGEWRSGARAGLSIIRGV